MLLFTAATDDEDYDDDDGDDDGDDGDGDDDEDEGEIFFCTTLSTQVSNVK